MNIRIHSLVFILFLALSAGGNAYPGEDEDTAETFFTKSKEEAYEEIFDILDIDSVDRTLKKNGIIFSVSIEDMVKDISADDTKDMGNKLKAMVKKIFIEEIEDSKNLMLLLISIVLLGSIFVNFSNSLGNGFISENGFYITYLIITGIMLTSFSVTLDMVVEALNVLLNLIKIIIPVYAVSINFVGHAQSAAAVYEIIMIGIWLVQVIIINVVIPMIKFFVIVSLINNLNKEDYFSKMSKLINSLVNWILKTIIVFIAGLNIIKSLIEPHIDMLGKNMAGKLIQALPTGSMISVLTGTFFGAGVIVKNSIGIAGIIFIGLIVLTPLLKTFIVMIIVRLTSVILQPIGEKRYIEGIEGLAEGIRLLMLSLFSAAVLFVLTIAIMAYATGNGGGL
ncbi:MAG: stage III sporulation protein AE [Lachnospiraceae bacterium]|nr:stage III sporulation protein AE [Lachnospiraceae bacterium]